MCLSEIDREARFNMYSQEWKMQQRHRRGIEIQAFFSHLFFFGGGGEGVKSKRDQRRRMETRRAEELPAKC